MIYIVTVGYYEENYNALVTENLEKAIRYYLENDGASIQIWNNEEEIHEYGTYPFEDSKEYEKIFSSIKFVESNSLEEYFNSRRRFL